METIRELERMLSFVKHPVTNTKITKNLTLKETIDLIKSDKYKEVTEKYRNLPEGDAKKKYKLSKFDMVIFGGVFNKRMKDGLIDVSGFAVIDLDNIPLNEINDIRNRLITSPLNLNHLLILFTSPTGNGLKLVYHIDTRIHTHEENVIGLCNFLFKEFDVKISYIDTRGKDIVRVCFLPHDPNIFINPKILQND